MSVIVSVNRYNFKMTISEQDILRTLMKSRARIAVAAWVVVLAREAAKRLFPYEKPIGRTIWVGSDLRSGRSNQGAYLGPIEALRHEESIWSCISLNYWEKSDFCSLK